MERKLPLVWRSPQLKVIPVSRPAFLASPHYVASDAVLNDTTSSLSFRSETLPRNRDPVLESNVLISRPRLRL